MRDWKPRTTWSDTLLEEELRAHVNAAMKAAPSEHNILAALRKAAVKGEAFRKLQIPSRQKLLDDWFREGDTGFIYSHRGVGKTWLAWAIARAIAKGERIGPWQAGEKAVPVCYLDGEMPAELMQERDKAFGDACENLTLINHEILFQRTGLVLNLAEPEVQASNHAMVHRGRVQGFGHRQPLHARQRREGE